MKSSDFDQAAAQAKEAVRLDPKSASACTTLGTVLMVQGYVGPAVDAYKQAVNLAPNDANVHWLLSRSMEKNGDRDGAIAQLNYFLQVCSHSDARGLKAREHLEELKAR
jgi:cytochrome c-type biogenesis protein CcmH/NrfG